MPDIGFIIQLLLRRLHYIVLIAAPVTTLGLWLALNLPPSYSAQARLLVESPQVPTIWPRPPCGRDDRNPARSGTASFWRGATCWPCRAASTCMRTKPT